MPHTNLSSLPISTQSLIYCQRWASCLWKCHSLSHFLRRLLICHWRSSLVLPFNPLPIVILTDSFQISISSFRLLICPSFRVKQCSSIKPSLLLICKSQDFSCIFQFGMGFCDLYQCNRLKFAWRDWIK